MRQGCIDAVKVAAKRPLTAADIQGIEDRIIKNRRTLARQARDKWQTLSEEE